MTLAAKADALRALHHADNPLILANVWDVASARAVAAAGFAAIATSNGAIAASLGHEDDDSMAADEAFGVVDRIARAVDVPVTADLEAGYGLAPAEFVARLLDAGAVGCNLEDTDHHGGGAGSRRLVDAAEQAARLAAIKQDARASGVDIVLNARIDVFLQHRDDPPAEHLDEAIRRARLYIEAGADCVYPIGLAERDAIGSFIKAVEHPVNIYLRPATPSIAELTSLGVARVSLGGGLMRATYETIRKEVARLAP